MAKTLYVGNLPWTATEDEVKQHFASCGTVNSVKIIMDRETGRSRGFCFVEIDNAEAAITSLNGQEFKGRPLRINEAREKPQR